MVAKMNGWAGDLASTTHRTFLDDLPVNANMLLGGPDFSGTNKQYEKLARKVADYVRRTKRFG